MKKILCLLCLTLTLSYGWSQINEKDTIITTIFAKNASVVMQADVFPDYVNLQWTKGPDDFTGYFELYRSADGIAYTIVRQFQPSTFEADQRYYTYRDEDPLLGKNYYRLVGYDKFTNEKRMIDLVAVYKNLPRKVVPTIVSNGNQLKISNYGGEELQICIYTSSGSPILKTIVSSSVVNLPGGLSKGLYVFQLIDRQNLLVSSGKFVLQ